VRLQPYVDIREITQRVANNSPRDHRMNSAIKPEKQRLSCGLRGSYQHRFGQLDCQERLIDEGSCGLF